MAGGHYHSIHSKINAANQKKMIPYVQLENTESVSAKKEILASQISILKITKNLEAYRKLRKLEIAKKILLKRALRQKIMKLNSLIAFLPESAAPGLKKIKSEPVSREIPPKIKEKKTSAIESQLQEIREKLARLS